MPDPRTFVLILTVAAFVLPTIAAVLAYRSATKAIAEADHAADEHDRIVADSQAELDALDPSDEEGKAAAQDHLKARYAAIGYPPPTYSGMAGRPAHAASRAVRAILNGARANAWLALSGLSCGLAASVWSLYLPAA